MDPFLESEFRDVSPLPIPEATLPDTAKALSNDDEVRAVWESKLEFIFSILSFAVGLGSFWRFPYLCYKNGGGVFFIPYLIMLFCVGIPVFLLELALGQYCSQSTLTCWNFATLFRGVGLGMCLVSTFIFIYYNVIIAWAIYYIFASFSFTLPWAECGSWSDEKCIGNVNVTATVSDCVAMNYSIMSGACFENGKLMVIFNQSEAAKIGIIAETASAQYLKFVSLQNAFSPGIEDIGAPRWDMAGCLVIAWVLVVLSLWKLIATSGKVAYFNALFPYIGLFVLLFNCFLLEGSSDGLAYFFQSDLSKLRNALVWRDAAVQIFFSISASMGGLITLSSHNKFDNDIVRDTLVVTIGTCFTSFLAGVVVFGYLGYFAQATGNTVDAVVTKGPALVFAVYPHALQLLPAAHVWSIIFFVMIICLGLGSEIAMVQTVFVGILDMFPVLKPYCTYVIISVSVFGFIAGLAMTAPGGIYVLTLLDDYGGGWNLLIIALCEVLSISYVYGWRRFSMNISVMIGEKFCRFFYWNTWRWWFIFCWTVLSPALLLFILIFSWIDYTPSSYEQGRPMPLWANVIGWCMTLMVVACIVIPGIATVVLQEGKTWTEKFKLSITPNESWRPFLTENHLKVLDFKMAQENKE